MGTAGIVWGKNMKLQQLTKLISKNFTVLSIASAFALGVVGMTDIKDNLFDTSKWFRRSPDAEQTEFENIAANPDKPDFDFGKSASQDVTTITEGPSETTTVETTTIETTTVETTTEITSSEDESFMSGNEGSAPDESSSDVSGSETSDPSASSKKTDKTEATEEPTEKTKKTKNSSKETTEEPSDSTTKAPKETTKAPKETTEAPKETTTAAPTTKAETTKPASLGDTSGSYNDSMAKEVLTLVNEQRAANGLAPLSWSGGLAKGAKTRATEIVVKWDHVRPDGSEWYTAYGCEDAYGENLGKGYGSAASVVDGWMNSKLHRNNILKSDYKTLGVACYLCNGQYYWVQEFGY